MKSKVAAKTGGVKYQWQIMQGLKIPDDEIKWYFCLSIFGVCFYVLYLSPLFPPTLQTSFYLINIFDWLSALQFFFTFFLIFVHSLCSFADTEYWLKYFPPHAMTDLRAMGIKVSTKVNLC